MEGGGWGPENPDPSRHHLLEIVLLALSRPNPELTMEIHTCDPQSVRVRTEARVAVGSSSVRGRVRVTVRVARVRVRVVVIQTEIWSTRVEG